MPFRNCIYIAVLFFLSCSDSIFPEYGGFRRYFADFMMTETLIRASDYKGIVNRNLKRNSLFKAMLISVGFRRLGSGRYGLRTVRCADRSLYPSQAGEGWTLNEGLS